MGKGRKNRGIAFELIPQPTVTPEYDSDGEPDQDIDTEKRMFVPLGVSRKSRKDPKLMKKYDKMVKIFTDDGDDEIDNQKFKKMPKNKIVQLRDDPLDDDELFDDFDDFDDVDDDNDQMEEKDNKKIKEIEKKSFEEMKKKALTDFYNDDLDLPSSDEEEEKSNNQQTSNKKLPYIEEKGDEVVFVFNNNEDDDDLFENMEFEVDEDLKDALEGDEKYIADFDTDFIQLLNEENEIQGNYYTEEEIKKRTEMEEIILKKMEEKKKMQKKLERKMAKTGGNKKNIEKMNRLPVPLTKEQRKLNEEFDKLFGTYDDDQIGELDENDPDLKGEIEVQEFSDYIQETLKKRSDGIVDFDDLFADIDDINEKYAVNIDNLELPEGAKVYTKPAIKLDKEKDLGHSDAVDITLVRMKKMREEEDLNGDKEEYEVVEVDEKDKWDCESILSTYSNLENHPQLIKDPSKKKKTTNKIELSKKTGMPLNVLPKKEKKKKNR